MKGCCSSEWFQLALKLYRSFEKSSSDVKTKAAAKIEKEESLTKRKRKEKVLWVKILQAKTRYAQQFRGNIKKQDLQIDEIHT